MAKDVRAIVIAGNGTNCELEMANACRLAGADVVDIVHIAELLAGRARLDTYHFLNLAGGFLDGDDLGSAKAGANRLLHAPVRGSKEHLSDQLRTFIAAGKLIFGVCNGFQLMVKIGLLPMLDGEIRQSATLTHNDGGRFEDRWVHLKVDPQSPCIFTRDLPDLYLPVRHGEGKFMVESPALLRQIEEKKLAVLRYCDPAGMPTMTYPHNQNGSMAAIAGICDETGRLFGLMPHPEAYVHRTHHPRWSREEQLLEEGMGLWFFRNAVRFVREELL